jgi:ankyrin repeat protein
MRASENLEQGDRYFETVKILLNSGADPNLVDSAKESSFFKASDCNDTSILKFFILEKADINLGDARGFTPLMQAALNSGDNNGSIGLLLKSGARVVEKDSDGKTALMYAAEAGMAGTTELLLKHGADPNQRDDSGKTALRHAMENTYPSDSCNVYGENRLCFAEFFEIADLLIRYGAKIRAADSLGITPLDYAVKMGFDSIIEFIRHK